jgi:anti-anti-sigma factor
MIEFSISTSTVTSLFISGKILSDADILPMKEAIDQLDNWKIVIDLSQLTHTNSSGIAFMVKVLTKSRINGGDTVFLKPNAGLTKLFEITKIHEVFTIFDSFESAKNHFN